MNVAGFSEHQNKTSDTDRYKRYFFTARVSQVNVNSVKRIFEQRSELQVAKSLIVHVMSSSYNVSRLELRNKKKTTQQGSLCVVNIIVLNQVGVYHERKYANNVVGQFPVCEVVSLSILLQIHYQHYFQKCVPDPY